MHCILISVALRDVLSAFGSQCTALHMLQLVQERFVQRQAAATPEQRGSLIRDNGSGHDDCKMIWLYRHVIPASLFCVGFACSVST